MVNKRHNTAATRTFHFLFTGSLIILMLMICCACTVSQPVGSQPGEYALSGIEEESPASEAASSFQTNDLPVYDGNPYQIIHQNIPFFTEEELASFAGESYSELDTLGRCGVCMARITPDTMPDETRGPIGDIRPSGWKTVKYDGIEGNYLYNRCHLIGWQLTGQNDNPDNLITGTRYLNVDGMEPFENKVANYVRETSVPVLYRVTPVFEGDNLVASGVLMEAASADNHFSFCVYCFNVQPGITINYTTGDSAGPARGKEQAVPADSTSSSEKTGAAETELIDPDATYVGNRNSMKFHLPSCPSVNDMAAHNRVYFYNSREEAVHAGYAPCRRCNP